jgi:hypothetical protein
VLNIFYLNDIINAFDIFVFSFRRERELASKVKAPAEAEKYKLEILAQANRVKSVAEV